MAGCAWSCALTPLCGTATFTYPSNQCSSSGCAGGNDASALPTYDEATARCAITALRDGTLGEVDWAIVYNDMFNSAQTEQMGIVGARQVYGASVSQSDTVEQQRFSGRLLQAPSFFQACLDARDVDDYIACLQNGLQPCL